MPSYGYLRCASSGMDSDSERSIVISALRAALDPAVARKVPGQLDVFLELELSGTSVQTKVQQACAQSCPSVLPPLRCLRSAVWTLADCTELRIGASLGSNRWLEVSPTRSLTTCLGCCAL